MRKFLVLFLFLIPSLVFAKGESLVIAIEKPIHEMAADDMRAYFKREYGADVKIIKYKELTKLDTTKLDGIIIMNLGRKSGYPPEIEAFTKSVPDKSKVVISNWYSEKEQKVFIDTPLNGVDTITNASSMKDKTSQVYAEIAKQLGLTK